MLPTATFDARLLPEGIRSRFVEEVNGLNMHILEAGHEPPERPFVLLLHGFPELAYSWRNVMLPLAAAGYHVVAPDQRGYGRTTGWDPDYDGDLASFRILNIVRDALALIAALGRESAAVIGHDFGSFVAAYCALTRPDVFRAAMLMSAPFGGPPAYPLRTGGEMPHEAADDIHEELAKLAPPRKHYQWYYGTRAANDDMMQCAQGLSDFLRAYFHCKSGDWENNRPFPLKAWTAAELGKLPPYYVMERDRDMAETVAPLMPSESEVAACEWLREKALGVYAAEFSRTGFQGGLQWYRCMTSPEHDAELRLFSQKTITVPACFIAGARDWGIYQKPGAFEAMQASVCERMLSCDLVEGAGHWVQQERPREVAALLTRFLSQTR